MEIHPSSELDAEIALLQRVATGDRKSFEDFYDRFSGVLFATVYRVLNDHEASNDVLQEVFLQIWEKAPLFDATRGKPLTWAVTLARHKAIDRLRAIQRRSRLQDEVESAAKVDESFDGWSSFDAVASAESAVQVRKALVQLSEDQRVAIELAFFSSLTHAEIAGRLNEPVNTIKARVRRGLMKLRDLLQAQR